MTVIYWLFSFTRSLAFEFDEFGSQPSTIVRLYNFVTTLKSLIVGWQEFGRFNTHSQISPAKYISFKRESNWKEYEMVCGEAAMRLNKNSSNSKASDRVKLKSQ